MLYRVALESISCQPLRGADRYGDAVAVEAHSPSVAMGPLSAEPATILVEFLTRQRPAN